MAPRAVLMKTGLKSFNTARPVNIVSLFNHWFDTGRPFRSTVNTVRARISKTLMEVMLLLEEEPMEAELQAKGKGIKREYSVARTPQQISVAERKNRTLIEAARTMLADSKLPTTFWVEAVSTACYRIWASLMARVMKVSLWVFLKYTRSFGGSSTSSQQDQDCIVMQFGKDAAYFIESYIVSLINTATPEDLVGPSHASEDTHVEGQEIELGNIPQSYAVPTTPHTRIHKDHPIEHVIGRTKKISKALSDPTWVEAMQEELYSFQTEKIEEEVYVCQPPGFEDPDHPDKVYKVVKALYGLHQAPRAWYDTLANYLLCNGFQRGKIDQTLFIKRQKGHILLVQIYVDDIIFGSTKKELCDEFEKLMKDKFQMSSMGELTFFIGLQIHIKERIFIQSRLICNENLRKFNSQCEVCIYATDLENPLFKKHPGQISYLQSCACARFQVYFSKTSHLLALLTLTVTMLELHKNRKSTTGGWALEQNQLLDYGLQFHDTHNMAAFLEKSTRSEGFHQVIDFLIQSHISYALTKKPDIYISFIKQFWRTAKASTDTDGEVTITVIIDGQSKTITEASLRRHLKLEDHDDMQKKQLKTHSKTYPVPSLNNKVFSNMRRLTKGYTGVEIRLFPTMLPSPPPEPSPTPSSSPSRITSSPSPSSEPSTAPTFEPQPSPDAEYHVPTPNESPLHVVHSHGSDEGSLKLNELTNLVTKLSERIGVLEDDLKKTKQTYSSAFTKLILRIKKLESKVKTGKARKRARVVLSEDEEDDSSKQGRIDEDPNTYFAQDDEVVHDQDTAAERQLEDSTAGITVSTAPINISTARESHSTAGRVVYGRRSKEARKDKGKEIMTEPEPVKKSKKLLEQERLGLEEAIRLQEKIDEEEIAQRKIEKDTSKKTIGKRKKSLPRTTTRSSTKKQKVELNDEKEDLKGYLDIVPREDVAVNVDSLSTKYPIVDWKTYTLSENFIQDIMELYRLVKERYSSSKPEGYDLMLWGDLHTLFEPDEESEIWMNQNEYNLISWSLCDFCGVHILLMQNGIAIHMLTEKKYPLSQEMISKMLSKRLEVDQESTQAYELLKFIRSQVKK
ncbi:putative ribonuclease H-like domain-containing protein [Tanacetum coccineum]|uniref:Ribonuclease H-like domain-containing protein n=1 Tax=Tanacetum coccineum TaxID=301880 RepID=A0ABQ5II14_9ASTR